jgi:Zn-dependent peptidase ImmA (M78 family)
MNIQQKHRIAEKVANAFRARVQKASADLLQYPVSFSALTIMMSETYPLAVHEIEALDIDKIAAAIRRRGGTFTATTLDRYTALAGFLYAHRGGGMIFIERGDSEERRKFSLAHELGHFLNEYYEPIYLKYEASNTVPLFAEEQTAAMQQVVAARCSERDIYGDGERIVKPSLEEETRKLIETVRAENAARFNEVRANLFAAEVLMPLEECRRLEQQCLAGRADIVEAVMQRFGVSRQAATYRVQELQLGQKELTLFDQM